MFFLFSYQNHDPPLIRPLSSLASLTVSSKLAPIYPLSFHSSPPFCHGIHNLCTPVFYYSRCIFSMPFSQTSILINNCRDNKNLPLGPLKNSLSASLQDLVVSTVNLVIYPSRILSIQTSTNHNALLSVSCSSQINSGVQDVGSHPWKFFFLYVNYSSDSYSMMGSSQKKYS